LFYLLALNNNSTNRNEYQLRPASNHIHHRQSIILPNNAAYLNSNSINFLSREPPPPYNQAAESRKIIPHRRNHPTANVRSRIEEYRRRLSVSDSDSDDQLRPRYRNPPRVKNEILLGKEMLQTITCYCNIFQHSCDRNVVLYLALLKNSL